MKEKDESKASELTDEEAAKAAGGADYYLVHVCNVCHCYFDVNKMVCPHGHSDFDTQMMLTTPVGS